MRALVTGIAGFVGSTLAARLVREGWDVRGIDMLSNYYSPKLKLDNLARLNLEPSRFTQQDILEMDLTQALQDVDVVFHQAGQPGVRSSWGAEFSIYTEANIRATQVLLEAARNSKTVKRFVYASSSSVYGDAERYPTLETDRPSPMSPYGVSKLAAEHLCVLYARNFGVPTVSLRYFTVYGPRQRPDMAFTRFCEAVASGNTVTIYGTGDQIRDFTFVEDIVDANVRAATEDVAPGSVFNIAGGTNISVNEVLTLLSAIAGTEVRVSKQSAVKGDVFRTGGDSRRASEELGWVPRVSIEEGLSRQFAWASDRLNSR